MLKLNHDEAQQFVESTRFAEWDGWDIVIFKPNRRAYTDVNGVLKDGQWGFARRIKCNHEGQWLVNEPRRSPRN
jgi:hypothetical protein